MCGSDGCEGLMGGIASDDDEICRVESELQEQRADDGQSEEDDLFEERSVAEVVGVFFAWWHGHFVRVGSSHAHPLWSHDGPPLGTASSFRTFTLATLTLSSSSVFFQSTVFSASLKLPAFSASFRASSATLIFQALPAYSAPYWEF